MNLKRLNEELEQYIDDNTESVIIFSDREIDLEDFLKILMGFYNTNNLEIMNERRKASKLFHENINQNNCFKNLAGAFVLAMQKLKLI